jgi:integrase
VHPLRQGHFRSIQRQLDGVPAAVIAAWIGHEDASLTMKLYAHSQDDALKAAGATLNRVVTLRDTEVV